MSKSRYKVYAQLDSAGGKIHGTVIIDRDTKVLHVRPFRRRIQYSMPLSEVADFVVKKAMGAEEKMAGLKLKRRR